MYDTVIELTVRNHPGVMSQITGLFARRNFNLEGILCRPEGNGNQSRMLLMIYANARMDQLVKQLSKLYDVISVSIRQDREASKYRQLFEGGWDLAR